MKRFTIPALLFLILVTAIITEFGCDREDIVVTPLGESRRWVEEYTAFSWPIFPHDSLLIVDSICFPDKLTPAKLQNDQDQIPMKTVLYFGWESLGCQIEIYQDDTVLVSEYRGRCDIIGDTIRFNIGDTIIQDYGYEFINSNLIHIYDFKWPDSNGVTFLNIPHDYIIWWGYAMKTEGVFTRREIGE